MKTLERFIARLVTKWGGKISLACSTFTQEVIIEKKERIVLYLLVCQEKK